MRAELIRRRFVGLFMNWTVGGAAVLAMVVVACGADISASPVDDAGVEVDATTDVAPNDASASDAGLDVESCTLPDQTAHGGGVGECRIVGRYQGCQDGYEYGCTGGQPTSTALVFGGDAGDAGADIDFEVQGCRLLTPDGGDGEARYFCPSACVYYPAGNVNCTAANRRWFLCPSGPKFESELGAPSPRCTFNGRTGDSSGYCCD